MKNTSHRTQPFGRWHLQLFPASLYGPRLGPLESPYPDAENTIKLHCLVGEWGGALVRLGTETHPAATFAFQGEKKQAPQSQYRAAWVVCFWLSKHWLFWIQKRDIFVESLLFHWIFRMQLAFCWRHTCQLFDPWEMWAQPLPVWSASETISIRLFLPRRNHFRHFVQGV